MRSCRTLILAVCWMMGGWNPVTLCAGEAAFLEQGFRTPPATARPWVYWFWLDGNITKEGITADLEAMHRVGLGGALWMWGGGVEPHVQGPVKFLDPTWWELMRHTCREADRLGLKINLTAGSGWSHSGGPWIRPKHGMRRLEITQELRLTGPSHQELTIPDSDTLVAVLAYPVQDQRDTMRASGVNVVASSTAPDFPIKKALDRDSSTRWISAGTRAGEGPSEQYPHWLAFEFPQPFAAAALYLDPFHDCGPRECQWQVSQDGKEYQTISRFELAPDLARTIPLDAAPSRHFRLLITSSHPFQGGPSWNVQIAEIQLLQAGERPLERETLSSAAAIDLTSQRSGSGLLPWDVPPGQWLLQVLHHRPTGDQPHPILADEGGLECDKLSPAAVDSHWTGYIQRVLDECGPAARRVIRWIHADSYEFGAQTWTPAFRDEFRRRCHYDPLPFLPAVLGRQIDDTNRTARFMWDFRRVRADLFAEGIGGHLRDLCRKHGIALSTEPHLVPEVFDQIQYGGHVSEPVGNFLGERHTAWYAPDPPVGPEVHLAKGEASSAAAYGLNGVVWAEAFTGVDHAHAWKETPSYLKTWGDLWLTEGINRFCFHCWAHSPSLTQKPGITLGPWGIHFDRRNTWFELATGYVQYLSRCQFLLQQGRPVVDVAMLTGDDVVTEFPRHPELRAAGYDYHGLTPDQLQRAKVKDGAIVLPSGQRYRLLVSYARALRPETLRKLGSLVHDGATILGTKPEDAPGLSGYPASRAEVLRLADAMWGSDAEVGRQGHKYGRGRVFWGAPQEPAQGTSGCGVAVYLRCTREIEVLRAMGVRPDFEYSLSGRERSDQMLAYIHRQSAKVDWYFISNQSGQSRTEPIAFRLLGRRPERWDPVTGETRSLPDYTQQDGRTVVPLAFAPGQSCFIVFRQGTTKLAERQPRTNTETLHEVASVHGPWQVTFDPQWGGPPQPVTFSALTDWSKHPEDGIKFYSGRATYQAQLELPNPWPTGRVYLQLGKVRDLAEVRVNGRSLGVVWCEPWRIELPPTSAHPGVNQLEIVVANEWVNRLIGDSARPMEQRFTWTTWNPYKPDSPLLESGLLGPVTISVGSENPLP